MDKVKNMAYWKAKKQVPEIAKDSPMKFLGFGKSPNDPSKGQGRKFAKALLNPAGAIANKMGLGDTGVGKLLNPGKLLGMGN